MTDFLTSKVRETRHDGSDDLLSAGLGLDGLRGQPPAFADAEHPTPAELRRRSIYASWKGIADLAPLGGFGTVYGAVPNIPGREFQAFARIPGAKSPHRVLAQIPNAFDAKARCLIVTAASGSRGVYGAIALAGAWGLPRGCAVVNTDKGAGSGYFDTASATGVALDGTRAKIGEADLEFAPEHAASNAGIAVKHAHSGDNPEAAWGAHVLQAARFGLAMLDRAYPEQAPFTPQNTRIIALGVSNGGGAVLQAAGLDTDHILSGVVAAAPNINAPHGSTQGRGLYNYVTEAAIWMPCALVDARFDTTPMARLNGATSPQWIARCAALHASGDLHGDDTRVQAAEALERLHASGWTDAAIESGAINVAFDLWRAVGATYASAYMRSEVGAMPCGFRFDAHDEHGVARPPTAAERAAWWADAPGIPPGNGVFLDNTETAGDPDGTLRDSRCLRALWTGTDRQSQTLRESVTATEARLPRTDLPIAVVHGREDGLVPAAFSSDPYIAWLRANGRTPMHWSVPHSQHFDAFLALPGFGDRYVPLMPYAYAAMDRMWAHLDDGAPLPEGSPDAQPRGAGALEAGMLGLR